MKNNKITLPHKTYLCVVIPFTQWLLLSFKSDLLLPFMYEDEEEKLSLILLFFGFLCCNIFDINKISPLTHTTTKLRKITIIVVWQLKKHIFFFFQKFWLNQPLHCLNPIAQDHGIFFLKPPTFRPYPSLKSSSSTSQLY